VEWLETVRGLGYKLIGWHEAFSQTLDF
jgi:hypothetical protein